MEDEMRILHLLFLQLLAVSSPLWADFVPLSQAPLSIVRQDAVFHVKKNGNFSYEFEEHLRVNNDEGRIQGATKRLPYFRRNNKIRVEWAKTVYQYHEFPVALGQIVDRSVATPQEGVTDLREKIIPFNNIFVGSEIQYKYRLSEKKPLVPGLFGMTFIYGAEEPEANETNRVVSEVPIYYHVNDPHKYLEIKYGREKDFYVLTVILKKTVFNRPAKEEILPVIDPTNVPTVTVSINKNWAEVASLFAAHYEKVLSQELPKEYRAILKKAEMEKSDIDRINIVTSEIAQQMTYSGDWQKIDDLFFPKDLKIIASLKTGDCKDFATATSAILRKMGLKASVALVQRMSIEAPNYFLTRQNFPQEEPSVNMQTWNHAIVKVTLSDKKVLWIDPTNPVSNAGYVKSDIEDSPALVLEKTTQHLETVQSFLSDSLLHIQRQLKIRGDNTAELESSVKTIGLTDVSFLELAWQKGEESLHKIYGLLAGFGEPSLSESFQGIPGKSRISKPTTVKVIATIPSPISEVKTEEGKQKISHLVFTMGLPPQLRIFVLLNPTKRATHMAIGEKGISQTDNEVEGYHIKETAAADCYMLSPWIDMERRTENTPTGFAVHFYFHQKKSFLLKEEMKSKDFDLLMADLQGCVGGQRIEVEPLKKDKPLAIEKEIDIDKASELSFKLDRKDQLIARRALLKILAANPKNARAHAILSDILIFLGYHSRDFYGSAYVAEAGREADLALQSDVHSADAHIAKAKILVMSQQLPAAKMELNQAYKLDAKNPGFFSVAAHISEIEKKFDIAERYLLAKIPLLKTDAQRVLLYNRLGALEMSAGNYGGAVRYFNQGLAVDPKSNWLLGNAMSAYMNLKKWDEAIAYGKRALEISEYNIFRGVLASAYSQKGLELLNAGRPSEEKELEIEKLFQSSLKLKADDPDAIHGMGVLYLYMGVRKKDRILLAQSKEYIERYLKINPTDSGANELLGRLAMALNMTGAQRLPASQSR
jgi:tetratricopeptide (TPR) repeat protein